jgi:hypothetical protein
VLPVRLLKRTPKPLNLQTECSLSCRLADVRAVVVKAARAAAQAAIAPRVQTEAAVLAPVAA